MKNYLPLMTLLIVAGSSSAADIRLYVKPAGTGTCLSWADACNLGQALESARSENADPDEDVVNEIWVKSGTYNGPVEMVNAVKMYGGFAGTETAASQSNPTTNLTILTAGAGQDKRVVYSVQHAATTVLRGFTIQNGEDGVDQAGGGGLLLDNSGAVFVQCVFQNNKAVHLGGAVAIRGTGSPHFVNCVFKNNGIGEGTSVQPLGAGAVFLHSGNPTFTNCLFHDNVAGEGGAFVQVEGIASFYNCTFAYNDATIGNGGAIFAPQGQIKMKNCILWGNTVPTEKSGPQIHYLEGYLPPVKYCNVQGGFAGTGNINADPYFIDAAAGNFDLPKTSPCKDAGNNPDVPLDFGDLDWDGTGDVLPKDLKGVNRKIQFKVDMGAYEAPFDPNIGQ